MTEKWQRATSHLPTAITSEDQISSSVVVVAALVVGVAVVAGAVKVTSCLINAIRRDDNSC